ncbi:ABC transporter ATP-binding protein [Corynebacterium canis]|uniref:ABC transporter ATP-binding protein n=1 Tax=Corynebacterium canis TaxID=679663 RepID=A0A5C5UTQ9_9CORY|nr:ABC transporter ATP-binding protein [Corynebacterium canis]TWT28923.1 ABC transporter ATP-binding protein [Corynebacterium canis]WJY75068.1 putative siderophore transport system ATP-binding protein YusV [Corynebacterium canis]
MTLTHQLRAADITLGYGERTIAKDLSVRITPGAITSIVGPNGCGKSTLLRALSRLLAPQSGQVLLDEKPLASYPAKQLARTLGLLPQNPLAPDGIAVADLVGRGRTPHQGLFGRWSKQDYEIVNESLAATGILDLAERSIDELSGGQRQRVWIAMALAQRTDILLLDEPTTFLDVANQLEVLDLLTEINAERGTTIVMVLHDLNLAARYSQQLIAMVSGSIYATGAPAEVITTAAVKDVFGIESHIMPDPVSGAPMVMPKGRHHVNP